jgi:hypothetical protein
MKAPGKGFRRRKGRRQGNGQGAKWEASGVHQEKCKENEGGGVMEVPGICFRGKGETSKAYQKRQKIKRGDVMRDIMGDVRGERGGVRGRRNHYELYSRTSTQYRQSGRMFYPFLCINWLERLF